MQSRADATCAPQPTAADFGAIVALIGGHRVAQAIYVAAELGIADLLAAGPRATGELATAAGADVAALGRILRFLAGLGLLEETAPSTFALTGRGAALRSDVAGSVRSMARMVVSDYHWRSWGGLLDAVRTGSTAFHTAHGMGLFDYLATRPIAQALFAEAMTANTARAGAAIAERYDFTALRSIVDVGGGRGQMLAILLAAHRHLDGVLLDRPEVVAQAGSILAEHGVAARCRIVGGDFFAAVPAGGDAYILRQVIHDWGDGDAARILARCRAALGPRARLLLIERRLAERHCDGLAQLHLDMEMLANVGGRERTDAEYGALLAGAGLQLERILPLGDAAGFAVFEAAPA